ncbi:MAG: hypothetical protein ACE5GB_11080 [Acidimicrobiales bacterium]
MTFGFNGLCCDHSFEPAADLCQRCGREFCSDCLVTPAGRAMCKACAIAAGGVRNSGARPAVNRRELKKRQAEFVTARALKRRPEEEAPVLTDPIGGGHDPIGPPLGEDMHRLGSPDTIEAVPTPEVSEAATQLANLSAPAESAEAAATDDDPADGIAPPIDWNRPFG